MKTHTRMLFLLASMSLLILALIALAAFSPVRFPFTRSAKAAPGSVNALTPGQNAAIQGAQQMLLLTLGPQHRVFLPLVQQH